jgi:DNA-binding Xre family transcriptional regulator
LCHAEGRRSRSSRSPWVAAAVHTQCLRFASRRAFQKASSSIKELVHHVADQRDRSEKRNDGQPAPTCFIISSVGRGAARAMSVRSSVETSSCRDFLMFTYEQKTRQILRSWTLPDNLPKPCGSSGRRRDSRRPSSRDGFKISRPTLNRLESTSQNTTLRTLGQLCRALKCRPGDLFEPGRLKLPGSRHDCASRVQPERARLLPSEGLPTMWPGRF